MTVRSSSVELALLAMPTDLAGADASRSRVFKDFASQREDPETPKDTFVSASLRTAPGNLCNEAVVTVF